MIIALPTTLRGQNSNVYLLTFYCFCAVYGVYGAYSVSSAGGLCLYHRNNRTTLTALTLHIFVHLTTRYRHWFAAWQFFKIVTVIYLIRTISVAASTNLDIALTFSHFPFPSFRSFYTVVQKLSNVCLSKNYDKCQCSLALGTRQHRRSRSRPVSLCCRRPVPTPKISPPRGGPPPPSNIVLLRAT